jgi:hypothetical protein
VQAQGIAGNFGVAYWSLIDDSQTPNWQNINDAQAPTWQNINNEQTPAWVDVEMNV